MGEVKGGSLDGRFLKLTPPDATVIRCYFSREHLQWSEAYALLANKVEIDDEDPDLVWPVLLFTERSDEEWH